MLNTKKTISECIEIPKINRKLRVFSEGFNRKLRVPSDNCFHGAVPSANEAHRQNDVC